MVKGFVKRNSKKKKKKKKKKKEELYNCVFIMGMNKISYLMGFL
jgi:hypothetical protein